MYCVVADIIDAFGSIQLNKLKPILERYRTGENSATLEAIIKRLFLHVVRFNQDGNWRRFLGKQKCIDYSLVHTFGFGRGET